VINIRPALHVLGMLIVMLAIGMLVPVMADLAVGNEDWQVFLLASVLTASLGAMLFLANRGMANELKLRQAFLLTTFAWMFLPAFAALPFVFSELDLNYTDAYFEAMSGLTTTGATILSGLDTAPPGILIWRSLLQWFGGIGVIVMTVAILPMLQVGGMQLFKTESFDTSEKIMPRAEQISSAITGIYVALTAICMVLLMLGGMAPFDAIAHAMTTIATGGFSTKDASIGHFDSATIDSIVIFFMILGSLPFVLYIQFLRGRTLALWRDEQVRAFLGVVLFLVVMVTLWLIIFKDYDTGSAMRFGSFNIISVLTGTGYATFDYGEWGSFGVTMFFFVMFIGGCAGSTSCGIKIFRFQVMLKAFSTWKARMLMPNGVFLARFNGRTISPLIISSVMSFFTFFIISFFVLSVAVAATGVDWVTALSGVGSAIANVGPGLGSTIGPAGNYAPLPDAAKWILAFTMLFGRLELFTILVIFTRAFWKH